MSELLRDYQLKRQRGVSHFKALRDQIKAATGAQPATVPGRYQPAERRYQFHPRPVKVDPVWSVLLGDAIYDLRAALDYLVTALVRSTGEPESFKNEFPIYGITRRKDSPRHFTNVNSWWDTDPRGEISRKLANTPGKTKRALKPLQPFHGAPRTNPGNHPLFQLQQLSNRDKHRRLNLLARVATEVQFVDAAGNAIYPGPAHRVRLPDAGEADSYSVTLAVSEPRKEKIFLRAGTAIHLHEPPELSGEVTETIAAVIDFLDQAVEPTVKRLL